MKLEQKTINTFIARTTIDPGDSFTFWVGGDLHFDHPKSNHAMLKRHLKSASQNKEPIIWNGDVFCAMQGRNDKRSDKGSLRDTNQRAGYFNSLVNDLFDFTEPYLKDLPFLVIGYGNHDTSITKHNEFDLIECFVMRCKDRGYDNVFRSAYSGMIKFRNKTTKGAESLSLYHHHGMETGKRSKGVLSVDILASEFPDADICISGHGHNEWLVKKPRMRVTTQMNWFRDKQIHLRHGTYKDDYRDGSFGWAVEKRNLPSLGAIKVRVDVKYKEKASNHKGCSMGLSAHPEFVE